MRGRSITLSGFEQVSLSSRGPRMPLERLRYQSILTWVLHGLRSGLLTGCVFGLGSGLALTMLYPHLFQSASDYPLPLFLFLGHSLTLGAIIGVATGAALWLLASRYGHEKIVPDKSHVSFDVILTTVCSYIEIHREISVGRLRLWKVKLILKLVINPFLEFFLSAE